MKIIGSEDYYDYVANIYGVDGHAVMDRREGHKIQLPNYDLHRKSRILLGEQMSVCFCGTQYFGILMEDGTSYWGDELLELGKYKEPYKTWNGGITEPVVSIEHSYGTIRNKLTAHSVKFLFKSVPTNKNEEANCPILFGRTNTSEGRWINNEIKHYSPYPNRLQDIGFARVVDPDTAFKTLYTWILNSKKDSDFDVLDNKEKIQAKGFDLKQSFRHR